MNTNVISESNLSICIAARAYELFERRNQAPGHDVEDWLHAEREVRHHFGLPNLQNGPADPSITP